MDPETLPEFQMRIDAATGGRLKFDMLYRDEHPYDAKTILRALKDGACDMISVSHMAAGDEPMLRVSTAIPFLIPGGDFELDKQISRKMGDDPAFRDIFRQWNGEFLATTYQASQHLYMKHNLIRSPEDFKGRKVRVPHMVSASWIQAMGGEPVSVPHAETYTALATGLVEGCQTNFPGALAMGFIDFCPYVTWVCANHAPYRIAANKESLEALPADVRDKFLKGLKDMDDWLMSGARINEEKKLIESFFTHGVIAGTIPNDWREELRSNAFEFCWKDLLDEAGPEGWQMFDMIVRLIEDEGYEVPGYEH